MYQIDDLPDTGQRDYSVLFLEYLVFNYNFHVLNALVFFLPENCVYSSHPLKVMSKPYLAHLELTKST